MTVGELKQFMEQLDDNEKVVLWHDFKRAELTDYDIGTNNGHNLVIIVPD